MIVIVNVLMFVWILATAMGVALILDGNGDELEYVFNPTSMHKYSELNVFGVIILSAIAYVILLPMAIICWFYKLFTIRRR